MTKKYDVRSIANELLKMADRHNNPLTNTQIQNMLYIYNCWSYGIFGYGIISEPAIKLEQGVVFLSLYSSLNKYGSKPVCNLICYEDVICDSAHYKGGDYTNPFVSYENRGGVVTSEIKKNTDAYRLLEIIFSNYYNRSISEISNEISMTTIIFSNGMYIAEHRLLTLYKNIVNTINNCYVISKDTPIMIDVYLKYLKWKNNNQEKNIQKIKKFYSNNL